MASEVRFVPALFVLLGSLCAADGVAGQTRAAAADATGLVVDTTGGAIRGATVLVASVDTGQVRTATTGADGRYAMAGLPVGRYRLRIDASGFVQRAFDVVLSVGTQLVLDTTLSVAGVSDAVTVDGRVTAIDVTRTDTSVLIDQTQITQLPINGRNYIDFSTLTPGATADRGSGSATSGLTFGGQGARSNNISIDGVDAIDGVLGTVRTQVSQEVVREFQVVASSFSAEFGKASGGIVNIVTRSGTNDRSATVYLYGRGAPLNARGHFDKFDAAGRPVDRPEGPSRQWQYGMTIGGPIRKDRSFYFGSVERQSTVASRFVSIDDTTVVTHPFAQVPLGTPASILRSAGFGFDTGNVPYDVRSTLLFTRVDHHLSPTNRLTGRFVSSVSLDGNDQPFGGLVAKSHAAALDSRGWELGLAWTAVRSQHWLDDLRVHLSTAFWDRWPLDPKCSGSCNADDQGGPAVDVFGIAAVGRLATAPSHSRARKIQVVDTVSYYRRGHQFRFGFDVGYRWASPVNFPLNRGGWYYFVDIPDAIAPELGLPGGMSSIQAFALGLPALYVQSYGSSQLGRITQLDTSVFLQDDWTPSPRLSVKVGARVQHQRLSSFPYEVTGIEEPYQFPGGAVNMAPRLALGWDPTGARRTSVQAAYGRYYDNNILATAGFSQVVQPTTGLRTLVAIGQPAVVAWNQPDYRLPEALAGPFPSLKFVIDPGLKTPYADHLSLGVNREFPSAARLSATLVSIRGRRQVSLIDYNPILPDLGPGRRPDDVDGVAGTSTSLLQFSSLADTWYTGLWLRAEKVLSASSRIVLSYTLAKAENNADDFAAPPSHNGRGRDPSDPEGPPVGFSAEADRGPSMVDERHRFVASMFHRLPGDVRVSSIVRIGSGLPLNISAGFDLNGDGATSNPDRPRTNPVDPATEIQRNAGRLPLRAVVDARLSRAFRLGTSTQVELLADVFNLFNRTNFVEANGVFGTGRFPSEPVTAFGQFTQAGPPREAQLAIRVTF